MNNARASADAAYRELVHARFAYEDMRRDPARLNELGAASERLYHARMAII